MAVPALVAFRGGNAQVPGKVDDDGVRLRRAQLRRVGAGDAVGKRQQVGVGAPGEPFLVGEPPLAAPGGELDARFRMAAQDPDGFPPGIAARSEHPDPHPAAPSFNDAKKKPTGAVRSSGWWSVGLWYGLDREPPPDGQASPASPRLSHGGSHAHLHS